MAPSQEALSEGEEVPLTSLRPLSSSSSSDTDDPSHISQRPSSSSSSFSAGLLSRRTFARLFSCSRASISLPFLGLLLLLAAFDSYIHHQSDAKYCTLTYMRPYFRDLSAFNSSHHRFSTKYSLHLYREEGVDPLHSPPKGIPVLFIHGNAGSYKQVRSLGAESALYYRQLLNQYPSFHDQSSQHGILGLDFFTVNLNEEFSALHGRTMLEQAEFINDAITYILSLYSSSSRSHLPLMPSSLPLPVPSSVILVAHSMGGVVARTAFTLPNYPKGAVNTLITLSSPHALAPAPFDPQIASLYASVNAFWRSHYEPSSPDFSDSPPFANLTLLSLAGGAQDTMINSDATEVNGLLPPSNGFTSFTSSIPGVWSSLDHHCILWCESMVRSLRSLLFAIIDARNPSQTLPPSERLLAMRQVLQKDGPLSRSPPNWTSRIPSSPDLPPPSTSSLSVRFGEATGAQKVSVGWDEDLLLSHLLSSSSPRSGGPEVVIPLDSSSSFSSNPQDYLLWSNFHFGSQALEVLACNISSSSSASPSCIPLVGHGDGLALPKYYPEHNYVAQGSVLVRIPKKELLPHDSLIYRLPMGTQVNPHEFLYGRHDSPFLHTTLPQGLLSILAHGGSLPIPSFSLPRETESSAKSSPFRTIRFPALINPAISYRFHIDLPLECKH